MKHLIFIGVGGFAREVYWYAKESKGYLAEWDLKGFLDGDIKLSPDEYQKLELPLLGDVASYEVQADDVFICPIANPAARRKLTNEIISKGGEFINLIHETAIVRDNVKMGAGNILCPYVHLQDHVEIGDGVIFNFIAGMGHDSKVGNYSTIMGSASLLGYAVAGENVILETGAYALPHSVIEDDVHVGIYSVVFKHAKRGQTVFGNPAVPI